MHMQMSIFQKAELPKKNCLNTFKVNANRDSEWCHPLSS